MSGKAVISLSTGLEDPEKVSVAFLVAVGAAESGRPTLMFQTKEAVRLALDGVATGVACDGCPPLPDLLARYDKAGGRYMVCPICFNAKQLDKGSLLANAELAGTVQLWEWIGDQGATSFSYGSAPSVSQVAMPETTAGSTCCAGSYSAGEEGPSPGKNRWLSAG